MRTVWQSKVDNVQGVVELTTYVDYRQDMSLAFSNDKLKKN